MFDQAVSTRMKSPMAQMAESMYTTARNAGTETFHDCQKKNNVDFNAILRLTRIQFHARRILWLSVMSQQQWTKRHQLHRVGPGLRLSFLPVPLGRCGEKSDVCFTLAACWLVIAVRYTHRWWCIAAHRRHRWCKFPPSSRSISERDVTQACLQRPFLSGNGWIWLSYFLHAGVAGVWVHECKGLHIKPPDLRVGRGFPQVVYRDRASHVVLRVGTSAEEGQERALHNLAPASPACTRQRLTRRTTESIKSVGMQGRQSSPARARTASGLGTAERWPLPRTQLDAGARTAGAGLRERRMRRMHLEEQVHGQGSPVAALRRDKPVLLPLAILMSTLKDPSATTGGGVVTACKERKLAARIKSDASYSHWTWRLKSPISSARFITADQRLNTERKNKNTLT